MKINYDMLFNQVLVKRNIPEINIDDAALGLVSGLETFIGKEEYQWNEAYDHVASWLTDNKHKGLLMAGGNGMGKTTMERILRVILGRYFTVKTGIDVTIAYCSAYDIRSAWENYATYQIIDDIGKEQQDYFPQIVDRAEQRKQLLICSTNLTKDELQTKYDGRTLDRMGNIFKTVFFKGESYRRMAE
jgi:DNA replication protein DnaC